MVIYHIILPSPKGELKFCDFIARHAYAQSAGLIYAPEAKKYKMIRIEKGRPPPASYEEVRAATH